MVTSQVKIYGGVPALYVNNKPINPMAYITYFTEKNMYREFADIGYSLYSVPVYFTEQTINEISRLPPFRKGVFDKIYDGGKAEFGIFDNLVAQILEHCPKAHIFPRVNVSVPYVWEERNPDECCEFGYAEHRRVSFFSDLWIEETNRLITLFVAHIEKSSYRDNIIGYQISAGNTEEWFPFDLRGCVGVRSREKFKEYCLEKYGRENGSYAEFCELLSERTADCVIAFSKKVKECTGNRLAVGAFYGYSYEVPEADRGHFALRRVLESEYVDFLCSPNSYYKTRQPGIDHAYMLPIDTLKKAGKLYLAENDTRTHLSAPPNDIPRYQSPVWFGPERDVTIEILKMHFAKGLCHGGGMWWFDMWGGWYRDEKYLKVLENLRLIYEKALGSDLSSRSEVAMFFDEKGVFKMDKEKQPEHEYYLMFRVREILGHMGTPYDMYLADDFESVAHKYKAVIVVRPIKTELSEACINGAKRNGKPVKVINNLDITADELRQFCRDSGVHIYCDKRAVIYANKSYVFMHTGEDAEFDFTFGGKRTFADVYTGNEISFPRNLPLGKSFLFKTE